MTPSTLTPSMAYGKLRHTDCHIADKVP